METRLTVKAPYSMGPGKVLPGALETQITTPLGGIPVLSCHYPVDGVNGAELEDIAQVTFAYKDGGQWTEPPNATFFTHKSNYDTLEEVATRKHNLIGVGWLLARARVWEAPPGSLDKDGKRQFLSATPGQIMEALLTEAKARGWGPGIEFDFTTAQDSAGQPWDKVLTIAYDLDLDLDTVLTNLSEQDVCDFQWQGTTLRMFNPGTALAYEHPAGTRLVAADGQTAGPTDTTLEDLLTDARVIGEDGFQADYTNGPGGPLGRLETIITQGGVSDPGTAALLVEPELLRGETQRVSYAREFTTDGGVRMLPYRDYSVGDWLPVQQLKGFKSMRVQSLSLTINEDGTKGHAILGDRLESLLAKMAKRTKGITGGASAGGTGGRPAPEGPDNRLPTAPEGLTVATDAYTDPNGEPRGVVFLNWAHDGKAADGTGVLDVGEFETFYRVNRIGETWRSFTVTDGDTTDASVSPVRIYDDNGAVLEYAFKVRAQGENGKRSAWSDPPIVATMQEDTTPPPVPYFVEADVTTWLRTVQVNWSGNSTDGTNIEPMPPGLDHVNVYRGDDPGMTAPVKVHELPGAGTYQSGIRPLATEWYALSAVDRSGNESDLTPAYAVTPVANVDTSEIIDKLDAGKVAIDNAASMLVEADKTLGKKLSENGALASSAIRGLPETSTAEPTLADGEDKPVNATWQQVNAEGKQIGFFQWDGAAWNSLPLDPVTIPVIQIGTGTAGSMDIERLTATGAEIETAVIDDLFAQTFATRKLTANQVLISPGGSVINDPQFEGDWSSIPVDTNGGRAGGRAAKIPINEPGAYYAEPYSAIPASDGEHFRVHVWVKSDAELPISGARMGVRWLHVDGTYSYSPTDNETAAAAGAWVEIAGTVEAPQDTVAAGIYLQAPNTPAVVWFETPEMVRAADGNLIVNGAITTKKLTVTEDMTVELLAAHKVTADEADLNTFTSDAGFVGDMSAGILKVGAIDPRMLDFGTDQLLPNPMWMDPERRNQYVPPTGYTYYDVAGTDYQKRGATHAIYANGPTFEGQQRFDVSGYMQAAPGDKFYMELETSYAGATPNWGMAYQMLSYDSTGAVVSYSELFTTYPEDSGWTTTAAQYGFRETAVMEAPDGTASVSFHLVPVGAPLGDYTNLTGGYMIISMSARKALAHTNDAGQSVEIAPDGMRSYRADGTLALLQGAYGMELYAPGGKRTVSMVADTGDVEIAGRFYQENDLGSVTIGPEFWSTGPDTSPALGFLHHATGPNGMPAGIALRDRGGRQEIYIQGPKPNETDLSKNIGLELREDGTWYMGDKNKGAAYWDGNTSVLWGHDGAAMDGGNGTLNGYSYKGAFFHLGDYWGIGNDKFIDRADQLRGQGMIEGHDNAIHLFSNGNQRGDRPWLYLKQDGGSQFTGGLNVYGAFNAYDAKNFAMSHPTKPGMELFHASTESPHPGVEYWGEDTVGPDGYAIVVLPEYFEALTTKEDRALLITANGAPVTWTDILDGEFMVEGTPGTRFAWLVKAARVGYGFETEQWVSGIRNAGEPERPPLPAPAAPPARTRPGNGDPSNGI